jgi:hypothetical protein
MYRRLFQELGRSPVGRSNLGWSVEERQSLKTESTSMPRREVRSRHSSEEVE